jgi:hypothetical protein
MNGQNDPTPTTTEEAEMADENTTEETPEVHETESVQEATPPDVVTRACRNETEHIGHYWSDGNPEVGYYCEGRRRG